jgi:uncharacterized membrane protein
MLVLGTMLVLGLALKTPCATSDWSDGRATRYLCYTDIVPLYGVDGLEAKRVPYFDARVEYPVLTGAWMYLLALPVSSVGSYFALNAVALALVAAGITLILYRLVGSRALYFAAAPVLMVYAFLNWDLLAVALATAALMAFLADRSRASGVLLGLGAAAKLYPALFVVPFAWELRRRKRPEDGNRLVVVAALTWIAVNLPFAVGGFTLWSYFFRFNAARGVNEGSTWFLLCDALGRCASSEFTKYLPAVALVVGTVLVVRWMLRARPDVPRWQLGFPLLIVFLLTTKVYSPQYDLWLLPWFALVLPRRRPFWAFQAASIAVFGTTFSWIGADLSSGPQEVALWIAVAARAAVLIYALVAFARSDDGVEEILPALSPA